MAAQGPSAAPKPPDSEIKHEQTESSRKPWWRAGRPTVWLTTLATVVAVATGMFTLRDQIFPSQSGSAPASELQYSTGVSSVCDALNEHDMQRANGVSKLRRQLAHYTTPLAERNAVITAWQGVYDNASHELAVFKGLEAPDDDLVTERETARTWTATLDVQLGLMQRLEAVGSYARLVAVVRTLPRIDRMVETDSNAIDGDLEKLGDGHCDLTTPLQTRPVTLPTPPGRRSTPQVVNPPDPTTASATAPRGKDTPKASFGGADITRSATIGPPVNPPDAHDGARPANP